MDDEYFGEMTADIKRIMPEQRLWLSVINRALQDAQGIIYGESDASKENYIEVAHNWLTNDSLNFNLACLDAGVDPKYIMKQYQDKVLKNQPNPML